MRGEGGGDRGAFEPRRRKDQGEKGRRKEAPGWMEGRHEATAHLLRPVGGRDEARRQCGPHRVPESKDMEHERPVQHLDRARSDADYFPATSLIEADQAMKVRGYTDSEREVSLEALEGAVPADKVIPNTASSVLSAVRLQGTGMDYFVSLIAALAEESGTRVITTDRSIGGAVETDW